MKKKYSLLIGISALTFSSCGVDLMGSSISSEDGIKNIKDILENDLGGGEKEIYSLDISAKDHLTDHLGDVRVDYIFNGLNYYQIYNETVNKLLDPNKSVIQRKKKGLVKIKDFDLDQIPVKYKEALSLLTAVSNEYENFTLNDWDFDVTNTGAIVSEFTIEGTKKGEGTSMQGKNIITNYYEFEFKIDDTGKLSMVN